MLLSYAIETKPKFWDKSVLNEWLKMYTKMTFGAYLVLLLNYR